MMPLFSRPELNANPIFLIVMQQISGQSLVSDVADLGSKLSKRVERVNFEYNTLLFN